LERMHPDKLDRAQLMGLVFEGTRVGKEAAAILATAQTPTLAAAE